MMGAMVATDELVPSLYPTTAHPQRLQPLKNLPLQEKWLSASMCVPVWPLIAMLSAAELIPEACTKSPCFLVSGKQKRRMIRVVRHAQEIGLGEIECARRTRDQSCFE